ncbi:MAG: type sorting protein [Labilithrix sp.]|nr:type sorting protein [Labilithrix sp.]
MRLVRSWVGGGTVTVALKACVIAAAVATLLVACATGTDTVDFTQGAVDAEGGTPGDGSGGRDSTVDPLDDAGADAKKDGATPPTGASHVVINELQADGAEFVELYNPTGASISLSGYEIKYQSAGGGAGGAGHAFGSGDSIGAGTFLLLTKANGKWVEGMAGAAGQIGLFDGSTLVDAVAYGSITGGAYGEGSPAPAPPTGGSIGRASDGVDSNKNAADFVTFTTPTPGSAN